MKLISRRGKGLLVSCCAVAGAALGQTANPLVGEWRGVTRLADGVQVAFDITYLPNFTYVETVAIPPNQQTGTGSGIIYSQGRYRLTSDHSVAFDEQERKACPNGDMTACQPIAAGGMGPFAFRLDGMDRLVNTDSGDIGYRVGAVSRGSPPAPAAMQLPPVAGPSPMQPCSVAGQTVCPNSGWLLTCNGTYWLTGSQRCK